MPPKPQAPPSLIKVRCSVSHVRSSVSKSQVHVRNVRSSVCQCSKCSVFGILVFVPPLVVIRSLRSTKCSSEMLQNLLYFMYKKTHVVFFVFHFGQIYIFALHCMLWARFRQTFVVGPKIHKLWNVFMCRITFYAQNNPHQLLTYYDFLKNWKNRFYT